jgi:hypothetical protein
MADLITQELQRIYDETGDLAEDEILRRAAKVDHPLHHFFEWDDKVAGSMYRTHQVRLLIRRARIVVRDDETEPDRVETLRAFVAVPGKGWRHVTDVARDPVEVKLTLQQMRRDWLALKRRYKAYSEFWGMVLEDDELQEKALNPE